jgi:hypothetical protein
MLLLAQRAYIGVHWRHLPPITRQFLLEKSARYLVLR